jgi:hypothetical protein
MVVLAVVTAGCDLVFPLQPADAASEAEGSDAAEDGAAAGSTCADLSGLEFCVDFETPGHRLADFLSAPTLNGGSVVETASGLSAPNAMEITLSDSGAAAFAFGNHAFANQSFFNRRFEWKMRGEAFSASAATCDATFVRIVIGEEHFLSASVQANMIVLELTDESGLVISSGVTIAAGTFEDWTQIVLVADFQSRQAHMVVGSEMTEPIGLPSSGLSGLLLQLGLQTGTQHAGCHALYDDVRVSRP